MLSLSGKQNGHGWRRRRLFHNNLDEGNTMDRLAQIEARLAKIENILGTIRWNTLPKEDQNNENRNNLGELLEAAKETSYREDGG